MAGPVRSLGVGAVVALAGAATGTAALAALPPYWQSAREIGAILEDPRVHDALRYEEPIVSISATGDDVYVLRTERCSVTVKIVDKPGSEPIAGPRQFDLEVEEAQCE